MNNFLRALQFVRPYAPLLIVSWLCAGVVSLLWAANISAVRPLVVVLFDDNHSVHQWMENHLQSSEDLLQEKTDELDRAKQTTPNDPQNQNRVARLEIELRNAEWYRDWYAWLTPIIQKWVPEDPFTVLVRLFIVLMLAILVKGIFAFLQDVLVASVTQSALFDFRNKFFSNTLDLDLAHFSKDGTAELMSRFTHDMNALSSGMKTLLGKMVREPLKAICCFAGACMISWRLTFLSVIVAPVAGWSIIYIARIMKRTSRRSMESMSRIYKILEETFSGIKTVKAFTSENHEQKRFQKEAHRFRHHAMKIAKLEAISSPLTEFMGMGIIAVALLSGAYLVLGNNGGTHLFGMRMAEYPLDAASLVTLYALLAGISDPARKLSSVFGRLQQANAALDRIFTFVDRKSHLECHPDAPELNRHQHEISLHDLHFHYQPDRPVLKGINLDIDFGECIALVGPNGCGKSTLASLLLRFYDPTEGTVSIDGTNLREVSLSHYRKQIGIVAQETFLFDDTIYNNIAYGSPEAKTEDIFLAAQRSFADGFIEQLPDGYETRVGEKGMLLSGGQRQRIALARAMLRNPSILILDEATSALDLESEHLIHQALQSFIKDRTTIIITHRLQTLTLATRIVVMENGTICSTGTHEKLVQESPLYQRLHEIHIQQPPSYAKHTNPSRPLPTVESGSESGTDTF